MKVANLKKKIVTGAITLCLVGGTGTVFATTNAGNQLQAWFNPVLQTSMNSSFVAPLNNYNTQRAAVAGAIECKAATAGGLVTTDGNTVKSNSDNAITAAEKVYDDQITATQTTILNGIVPQYNTYRDGMKANFIDPNITRDFNGWQGQINAAVDGAYPGASALVATSNTTRTDMNTKLTQTITAAKTAISTKVKQEEDRVSGELSGYVDSDFATGNTNLTNNTAAYVKVKTDLLDAAGAKIVTDSQTELDNIVADINK
jgi:hypothetical protein